MKVKTLVRFIDLEARKTREIGDVFDVTQKRLDEINSTSYGELVEVVKGEKKSGKSI